MGPPIKSIQHFRRTRERGKRTNLGYITIIYQFGVFVLRRIDLAEWRIWLARLLPALISFDLLLLLIICR